MTVKNAKSVNSAAEHTLFKNLTLVDIHISPKNHACHTDKHTHKVIHTLEFMEIIDWKEIF
jgi:hypothetical protein